MRSPKSVGAILPTSSFFVNAMLDASRLDSARVVVELGAGTGVFTREILRRLSPQSDFICVETNPHFCDQLRPLMNSHPKAYLECSSAERLAEILDERGCERVDTVISALPYNSLPLTLSKTVLQSIVDRMDKNSEFLTVLYSMSCRSLFNEFFSVQDWRRVYRNIPPAYLAKMAL